MWRIQIREYQLYAYLYPLVSMINVETTALMYASSETGKG